MTLGAGSLLLILGLIGGIVSGLLGIGGAVLVIPLLLYVPPLFGIEPLPMGPITGITMAQVFAASLSGIMVHRRAGNVDMRLVSAMGPSVVVGSFVGAMASRWLAGDAIKAVYTGVAILAAVMMLRKPAAKAPDDPAGPSRLGMAAVIALAIGLLAGLVGVGGAFMLLPVMIAWLRVPLRTAVGTSLGIVLLSSIAGLAGKILTHQVPWVPAILVVAGAIAGARLGARWSVKLPVEKLRWALAVLIAIVAVRLVVDLLS